MALQAWLRRVLVALENLAGGVAPGGSFTVDQANRALLNADVAVQVGGVDVGPANLFPIGDGGGSLTVDQAVHDLLNLNANLQVGDTDVSDTNPVPIEEAGTTIAQTPIISAAAVYAAGDNVGGLLEFANAARVAGDGGVIVTVVIVDDDQEDAELELWLFSVTFTAGVDNAQWDPSDVDMENHIGVITTVDGRYYDSVNQGTCTVECTVRYDLVGTSLFGRLVNRGTPTYTAVTDITIKIAAVID